MTPHPALRTPQRPFIAGHSSVVTRTGRLAWALGLTLLFFYLLSYVMHTAALARYPYDVDQGEGYDLNSAWLIAQGRPIYTDNELYPYYSSNYPPVFSLLLAPLLTIAGPSLGVGRLLSAAAAVATALLIAAAVYRQTASAIAAATAGLFFIGSNYVYHVTPLVRVNALATCFGVLGLYCCLRGGARGEGRGASEQSNGHPSPNSLDPYLAPRPWVTAAIAAFLLALFTKQTTVDAVAAGLLFLLLRDRRTGIVAALAVGLIGGLLALLLDLIHGGQFFVNVVVGNVNPFIPGQAVAYYLNFLELHGVLVGLAAWQAWRAFRTGSFGPFELYWVLALGLAVSVGKWGAGESYFLAPIAASCVLAGCALAGVLRIAPRYPRLLLAAGLLVLTQSLLLSHGPLAGVGPFLADRGIQASMLARQATDDDLEEAAKLLAEIRYFESPVLAEDPAFALAAGKAVVGNATHLRNLHQAGAWRPDNLVADLAERRFNFVVLDAELYPEPVLEAIGRHYYLYETYAIGGTVQQLFAAGGE